MAHDRCGLLHRWTAENLKTRSQAHSGSDAFRGHWRRAGEYLLWRVRHISHALTDGIEAVRSFLEAAAFDQAATTASAIVEFMKRYGQQVDVAAFASEVLASLPSAHTLYPYLCATEADAIMTLSFISQARQRYQESMTILQNRVGAEPDRADYQRDLVVSLLRIADSNPLQRIPYLSQALDLLRPLHTANRLFPEQTRWLPIIEQRLQEASQLSDQPEHKPWWRKILRCLVSRRG